MKMLVLLGFVCAFLFGAAAASHAIDTGFFNSPLTMSADRATSQGVLQYFPDPDFTICYCGSYYLSVTEKQFNAYYLLSDNIDLSEFIGQRITVTGTILSAPCEGTLYRLCDFLVVNEIKEIIHTGTQLDSWGRVKALFEE